MVLSQATLFLLAEALFIVLLFLMFILRMCYFFFIKRTDPAKALTQLLNPDWFRKNKENEAAREKIEKYT